MKFKNIYQQTRENVELALLSLWAPGKHRMRSALKDLFKREPLLAEPVFQSIFPWKNTQDPNWESYLDKDVVDLQKRKAAARGDVFIPFAHQAESWKTLKGGDSIVVTSGTGSGKTECFMLPVLGDLHSRAATIPVCDTPVEALFLYPLNALMQDQKDRLGKDCQDLGLRFAVYNGSLEESKALMTPVNPAYPDAEVRTRNDVRRESRNGNPSCPHILLTNPSMLEFMLVRDRDQRIFERSKGKLRWIIIDEAHTYTGSAAVELSYLIKRVLSAFGVTRDDVRFVCTSATIGDKAKPQELIDFIETISGKYSAASGRKLVHIDGDRDVKKLQKTAVQTALAAKGLSSINAGDVLRLRDLVNDHPMTLSSMMNELKTGGISVENALDILDALCEISLGKDNLLMLRGHFFMRTISGLYACVNEHCAGAGEYRHTGFVYLTTYKGDGRCPHCGAPLFELVQCGDCKEFILECLENDSHELRVSYHRLQDAIIDDVADDDDNDDATAGGAKDGNWTLLYLAWYGPGLQYLKPHPDYVESHLGISWDGKEAKTFSSGSAQKNWMVLSNNDYLFCPTCARGSGSDGSYFSSFRLSANWLNGTIAPALMKEGADPNNEWGKYIAFTDSRQGTAINAKRFNVEAERAFARARLVESLSNPQLPLHIVQTINTMMQTTGKPYDECVAQIAQMGVTFSLPIFTIREAADQIFDKRIFEHIDFEVSQRPGTHTKDEEAYKTSLVRSIIGRRPVHLQSIENLGFVTVRYAALANPNLPIPASWSRAGFGRDDFKAFVKIAVDYVIRIGNHLQSPTDHETQYLRDSDRSTPFDPTSWPHVQTRDNGTLLSKQNRLVLLLCAALGIRDKAALAPRVAEVNSLINEATAFIESKILTQVDQNDPYWVEEINGVHIYDGWCYLDMSLNSQACSLELCKEAWLCPVTNQMLDTLFCGVSPSIKGCLCPENLSRFTVTSGKIKMPILGSASFGKEIIGLKSEGIWNDRHKYAYIGAKSGYLTAEHSGQQNREILAYYTESFKKTPHELNLLQCSTTMEMGVDIGDIDTVLMTNIPPTSANYMQRAGRAGRRGQSKSVSFSLCPNTAIGAQAFRNPMDIITGVNPAVRPVESDIIIQRHMNSFLVREFLCDPANVNVTFSDIHSWLTMGGFYNLFDGWLFNHLNNQTLDTRFQEIFGTSKTLGQAIGLCRIALQEVATDYQDIFSDIEIGITSALAANNQALADALSIQGDALMKQDPKGYLAEQQFLPNANMPTGVVEFNHIDAYHDAVLQNCKAKVEQCKQVLSNPNSSQTEQRNAKHEKEKNEREIAKILENSVSSREIKVALSEYAPGQMVVLDERNYVSAGIEWRNSLNQRQPWKYIYHCSNCGRYEYTADPTLTHCPHCGGAYEGILFPDRTVRSYAIEPSRFRTDVNKGINRKEHTDRVYYDIQSILTEVDWNAHTAGPMCDLVGSEGSEGEIVFYNKGEGAGFNLCLDCGRMEVSRIERTSTNWNHKSISERKKDCPNTNPYNNIILSGRFPTSFVSMRFYKDPSGQQFEKDSDLLYSLGALLCRALTRTIGVSSDDVDFDVRAEHGYLSLFIYDTQKGGCGYATRMMDPLTCNSVFAEARKMLFSFICHCESNVEGACVHCLIDRNTQRLEGHLSKYKLMEWFSRQVMNVTNLPQGVTAVTTPLKYLVTGLYSRPSTTSITFCADASEMNISDWSSRNGVMGRLLNECVNRGLSVKVQVAGIPDATNGAGIDRLVPFADLPDKFKNWGVDIEAVDTIEAAPGHYTALVINGRDHYYTDQRDVLNFNESWGESYTSLFEDHNVPSFKTGSFPTLMGVMSLLKPSEVIRMARLGSGTRATVNSVFATLKPTLLHGTDDADMRSILSGKTVDINFSDTYVNSALAALMLVYMIDELRNEYSFNIGKVSLKVRGAKRKCSNDKWSPNTFIRFNFQNEQDADDYLTQRFEDILGVTPFFSNSEPDHDRWLHLEPVGGHGNVEIRPDHGICGGWLSPERYVDADWLDGSTGIEVMSGEQTIYYIVVRK